MKLLTTIAAVLISISAFSQDYVEYDNGTFTQNGEELSMEQIDDLTVLHKAGRGNVRKGNRFDHMYKNGDLRISNNGLNAIGGMASGVPGGLMVLVGGLSGLYSIAFADSYYALESIIFLVPGAGLSAVSSVKPRLLLNSFTANWACAETANKTMPQRASCFVENFNENEVLCIGAS